MVGHTLVSSIYSYFDCLFGISNYESTISSSDCRQQEIEKKNWPTVETCWLGTEVVSPHFVRRGDMARSSAGALWQ